MKGDAGQSPLDMLLALWIGSMVLWGAISLDSACLTQRHAWHTLRQAEQRAQLALNMITNTMQQTPAQVEAQPHRNQTHCRPTGCTAAEGEGNALIIRGTQTARYFLRGTDLWLQVAGKGAAVAVVSGITRLHWVPDDRGDIGTVWVTAASDRDPAVTFTQHRTVVLGGRHDPAG